LKHSRTLTYTCYYNGNFPGKPGLACCPLEVMGYGPDALLDANSRIYNGIHFLASTKTREG